MNASSLGHTKKQEIKCEKVTKSREYSGTNVKRKRASDIETKNSRTSPDTTQRFLIDKKRKTRPRNLKIGKTIYKKSNKNKKNSKIQCQIAASKQTTSEKANFCSNTVFSFYLK